MPATPYHKNNATSDISSSYTYRFLVISPVRLEQGGLVSLLLGVANPAARFDWKYASVTHLLQ